MRDIKDAPTQSLTITDIDDNEVLQLEVLTLSNPLQTICLEGHLSEGTLESAFFSTHGQKPVVHGMVPRLDR